MIELNLQLEAANSKATESEAVRRQMEQLLLVCVLCASVLAVLC